MGWFWRGPKVVVIAALALGILGFVVMELWNSLLPGLLGLKPIGFWQAAGLLLLSRILFGGVHYGLGHRLHRRHHMIQRWENMNPEERERCRHGIGGHFSRRGGAEQH